MKKLGKVIATISALALFLYVPGYDSFLKMSAIYTVLVVILLLSAKAGGLFKEVDNESN